MNNNRRGFLRNLGAALAGAAAVGTIASDAKASVPVVSEPVKALEPQIVYRDIPTFDEVLAKVKENKDLNDLEVLVFVGEFTLTANKIDIPEINKLRKQGYAGHPGSCYDAIKSAHPNNIAMDYWAALHGNVKNLAKVHRHVQATLMYLIHL